MFSSAFGPSPLVGGVESETNLNQTTELYDIAKTAENALGADLDSSRKLKIKTKVSNGVSFTTEGDMAIPAKLLGSFTLSESLTRAAVSWSRSCR
ncbi:hypothetical protein V7S43_003001 [Phytophthora oleae]|uniref:Uncharacterized protein n=1 Tax=Phytophthora oleae TaxID=2107226 RepID=A0ABD3G2T5_9STRA